jgi:hypothetical protein
VPPVIKRVQYFDHQFLQVADFTDEQAYHREMLELHNANLHTPGVATGLGVTFDSGSTKVTVAPGMAVDSNGMQIVLANSYDLELASFPTSQTVYVVISHADQSTDPATDGSKNNTRTTETPDIEGQTALPTDQLHLVLAAVTRNQNVVTAVDPTVRSLAGAVGGNLEVNALTLEVAGAIQATWPVLTGPSANLAQLSSALTIEGALTAGGNGSSGATINGPLAVSGAATVHGGVTTPTASLSGVLTAAGGVVVGTNGATLKPDQGGSLELGGTNTTPGVGSPYIDFHYSGVTQDYNARIINDANGQLTISAATTHVAGNLLVTGAAITPAVGNAPTAGIEFPNNPGGGAGDEAFIRYYVDSTAAETTRLVIGIANDFDDRLGLVQAGHERLTISYGNVGINETDPQHTFQVTSANEVHSGGVGGGYSFANRNYNNGALADVGNYAGSRWVWYAATGPNFGAPGETIVAPGQARLWSSGDLFIVASDGNIGVRGYDPHNGLPGGWGGGIHTFDLYAEGTVGAGVGGGIKAYMNSAGAVVGASKSFLIEHPLDGERDLLHSAVEGPEHGVYYRGEGQLQDGRATVELPRYFEALCRAEGRSVQITPRVDDAARAPAVLGATPVRNGAFTVVAGTGTDQDQGFYWEVKAVRNDLDELEVEPMRGASPLAAVAAPPTNADPGGNQ